MSANESLLQVCDLRTSFAARGGIARAVDGISFEIKPGEVMGLVGESGCGKSVTALSIMRLVSSTGRIESGEVLFKGRELTSLSDKEMCEVRGNDIAMIFQEPMTSLNPVLTCGSQIIEAIRLHQNATKSEAADGAVEMLSLVGIPAPVDRMGEYPHQLSGGMRQRVMIAMALSCNPDLLIADEPTTALDVTIQAQILELIRDLQQRFGMAVLLITHDLGVVAQIADRVAVMYAGEIVEQTGVERLFERPSHPYTRALLRSIPSASSREDRLETIPGTVPDARSFPSSCRFKSRCSAAIDRCFSPPRLEKLEADHWVSCWRAGDGTAYG